MTAADQIEKLNRGERILTYELLPVVRPYVSPIIGEIRYIVPLVPSSWEPLASMMPLDPVRIIWTGKEWVPT